MRFQRLLQFWQGGFSYAVQGKDLFSAVAGQVL